MYMYTVFDLSWEHYTLTHQGLSHGRHPAVDMSIHCLHIKHCLLLDLGKEVPSKVGDIKPVR